MISPESVSLKISDCHISWLHPHDIPPKNGWLASSWSPSNPRELPSILIGEIHFFAAWSITFAGEITFLLVKSPCLLLEPPVLLVKSPFSLVKSPFLLVKSPFLLVKSAFSPVNSGFFANQNIPRCHICATAASHWSTSGSCCGGSSGWRSLSTSWRMKIRWGRAQWGYNPHLPSGKLT